MVANFSGTDPKTNAQYIIDNAYITRYYDLGLVSWGNRGVNWKAFLDLYNTFKFSQIRWSCQNSDGSKAVDIATALTEKGLSVVKRFFEDTAADTCGSFYRLPADKSTVSQNCGEWNKGIWFSIFKVNEDRRLYYAPFFIPSGKPVPFHAYVIANDYYSCDELQIKDGRPGSWWRVYIR